MHIVGVLALLFALVFGLVGFVSMIDMNTDIAALTTGGIAAITGLFPVFWMLVVGGVAVVAVVVAVKAID